LVGGIVNIGQIPGQVPEPVNDRVQEGFWILVGEILVEIPEVLWFFAEFLVTFL